MKRNIRITAAALCAALLFGAAAPVLAEGTSASAEKDETVYMVLNEDGSVRSQTVSVWLHDENGLAGAADRSSLSGLRTLKGEAMPEQAGNELVWNVDSTDVYYQGTTEQTPPVTARISYELDGKNITADELAGKSGHVAIHIALENHEKQARSVGGAQRTVYTPFITVIAADLPRDVFHDVKAANGVIQTDSENQLAAFVAMPGMAATFDGLLTGELAQMQGYFLDEVTIEADAENFAMPTVFMAAATELEQLEKEIELPDMGGLSQVKSATAQLDEGAQKLAQATAALRQKMGEFSSSYSAFDAGVDFALAGAKQVKGGTDSLLSGATELSGGLSQLKDGTAALKTTLDEELLPGLQGAAALQAVLQKQMEDAQGALAAVPSKDTISGMVNSAGQALNDAGTAAANEAGSQVAAAYQAAAANCAAALQASEVFSQLSPEQQAALAAAAAGANSPESVAAAAAAAGQAVGGITAGAGQQVSAALGQLAALDTDALVGQFNQVQKTAGQLLGAMNALTEKLYNESDNSQTLYGAAAAIAKGAGGAAQGADALTDGAQQLNSGAASLQTGLEKLSASSKTVKGAIAQFQSGSEQLAEGAGALAQGTGEFQSAAGDMLNEVDAGKLAQAADVMDAMQEQANEYTSYTGAADGTRASVKFIMKVDGPETQLNSAQEDSVPAAQTQPGFWQRVKELFA